MKTLDRREVILDIFAQRARTREGKLQVELAQLSFRLGRLAGGRKELSRLGGGIGTRGPGEKKLEEDRRRIRAADPADRAGADDGPQDPVAPLPAPQGGRVPGGRAGRVHQRGEIDPLQPADGGRRLRGGQAVRHARPHGPEVPASRAAGRRSSSTRSGSSTTFRPSCGRRSWRRSRGSGRRTSSSTSSTEAPTRWRATSSPWTPSSRSCRSARSRILLADEQARPLPSRDAARRTGALRISAKTGDGIPELLTAVERELCLHRPERDRFDQARLINIANGLTAMRVLLVPLFVYLLISRQGEGGAGGLRRLRRSRTASTASWRAGCASGRWSGRYLDPIADKLLMATAFIVLAYVKIVPLWLTILVISRDLFILVGSSLYLLLIDATDIRPTAVSKLNTAVQILTVVYFLAYAAFPEVSAVPPGGGRVDAPRRGHRAVRRHHGRLGAQYLYMGIRKLSELSREGVRVGVRRGRTASPRPGRDPRRGPDPLGVGQTGRGPPRPPLPDLRGAGSPSAGGMPSGAVREKAFRPAGKTAGDHPGADPRPPLPQPVHLLLRPPAPEGACAPPCTSRTRTSGFPSCTGSTSPFPTCRKRKRAKIVRYRLSPLYVSIHTTVPGASPPDAREPAGARDVMDVMRRLTARGSSFTGRSSSVPGSTTGRSFRATPPGALRPSARACGPSRWSRSG